MASISKLWCKVFNISKCISSPSCCYPPFISVGVRMHLSAEAHGCHQITSRSWCCWCSFGCIVSRCWPRALFCYRNIIQRLNNTSMDSSDLCLGKRISSDLKSSKFRSLHYSLYFSDHPFPCFGSWSE